MFISHISVQKIAMSLDSEYVVYDRFGYSDLIYRINVKSDIGITNQEA